MKVLENDRKNMYRIFVLSSRSRKFLILCKLMTCALAFIWDLMIVAAFTVMNNSCLPFSAIVSMNNV